MKKETAKACKKCAGVDFTVILKDGRRVVLCACGMVYDVNYFLPE